MMKIKNLKLRHYLKIIGIVFWLTSITFAFFTNILFPNYALSIFLILIIVGDILTPKQDDKK